MSLQIKHRIRKVLTHTITGIFFLLITAFLTLQIPAVQEYFIKRYLGNFSQVTGFQATVGSFQLLWFDRLELKDLTVHDPEQNKMIAAETVVVNFKLSELFEQRDINIDGVFLEGSHVYITRIHDTDTSTNLNINVFVNRVNAAYGGPKKGGRPPRVNIGEAVLEDSQFSYIDQEKEPVKSGFNYNQFTVHIDESQLQNFLILGDTTQFKVNTLLATDEDTRFPIKQLSTFFRLSQQSMEFIGLNMQAGQSTISDTVIFTFNGQRELSEFVSKVNIHANLRNTIILPQDLALFAPAAEKLKLPIALSGVFDGRIDDFRFTQMEMATGRTILRGSLDMEGLPDVTETFIILRLENSKFDFEDFSFLFKDQILQRLIPIGAVNLQGEFLGYPTDFVAKGEFSGRLGRIASDINFKVNEDNFDQSEYSGKLALHDFELGTYLKDTVNFQTVNLSGNVKGSGLTVKTADFILNGKVNSLGIRRYNYKDITTNARFASQLFNGFIKIEDPNLRFSAQGSVDLREGINTVRMKAVLDTAFLQNLKLTAHDIFVRSDLDINIKGLHVDSLVGTTHIQNFRIRHNDRWLALDDIRLAAERTESERRMKIETNLVDAEVTGNYLISEISKDIQVLVKEIMLNIRNDKDAIEAYYIAKRHTPRSYQAAFTVDVKDIDPIVSLVKAGFSIGDNTHIEGNFTSGYTSILQAFARIDSIHLDKTLLLRTEVELNASKIADSTSVLAMAFVNSERQELTPKFITRDLVAEAIWNKNHIDFEFDADQEGQSNYVRLQGAVDFLKDSTQLKVLPSSLHVLGNTWDFDPDNLITIKHNDIDFRHLTLRNGNQFVSANGTVSPDPQEILRLDVNDFDLSLLNALTGRDIRGTLDAVFDLSSYYTNPHLQNNVLIDSLSVDNFLIGDVSGKNLWDTLQNRFIIDFFIDRYNSRIVNLSGYYTPSRSESPLDLKARLEQANLKILEPFLEDIFSNIGGTVTGDFSITGKLREPAIQGEGNIFNGQIMVNYLKTIYRFTGVAGLTPRSIYFRDIEMVDIFNNRGRLNGVISHQNFYGMRINIDASFENFQVLNTTTKDNDLFYGQGYASGDLNLFGPVSNLKITANARTDKNTRISIPIGGTSEVERKDFIKFVSFTDSTFQKSIQEEIKDKVDLTGVTLDFNLDVTPDAYCEIILDLKAGDIIRGRGNGELQLQFDTKGEFNMFGPFEFTEGWYNFTLYDIINKEFEIKRGSRITWYGDAYEGVLDISASYNQLASFAHVVSNPSFQPPAGEMPSQLKRKYPAQVLLELDGPMLKPQINFDIVAPELPQTQIVQGETVRLAFDFQAFKNRMDEQELKRQVFSLIVLRRFSLPDQFDASGSIANSVSELLSNQLSNWASQVDENLEVDIDLSTFDEEAFNTFQLRLSYSLFNGRLRITRDATTFYGGQNSADPNTPLNQQNSLASIAGDWTVDYLLTADGKLKVKMYNRTNYNPILNTVNAQSAVTAGVSLSHTQTFNELKDLWRSSRNRRKETPEPDEEPNDEAIRTKHEGTE